MASVRSTRGMVATSERHAAEAGRRVLADGGSAADAAIAMAAALTVVEPCSNGLGSDAFALVWDGSQVHGLSGAGRSPAALTLDEVRSRGHETMPLHAWESVTVPGAVRSWADLHAKFGRLPFERLFADAIAFARDGFEVTPTVARAWEVAVRRHATLDGPEFAEWARVFAPDGRAPEAGERWSSPDHARTLELIAASGSDAFYTGELAERTAAFAAQTGGWLTADDLAEHRGDWVDPIKVTFRGHEVYEMPPSGQGIATLQALNILDGFDLADVDSVESVHWAIEATKLALTDAHSRVADPDHVPVPVGGLLSSDYASGRRAEIGDRAIEPTSGDVPGSETVYLCAADSDGQMVSFIQSNFHGFGSFIVVPGTGIALQNRGRGFSLDPGHPNVLAPRKRPFHTIIPGFLRSADGFTGPFGVMGGHMQAQGHVQVVLDTLVAGDDPQAALDRPRWYWDSGLVVECEDASLVDALCYRGHDARPAGERSFFGRGQIIWRTPDGEYFGGTENRCDGAVLGL